MGKSALIVGGGFSGCTVAHLLGEAGWDCTIVERESGLGGGCRTLFYGGHPYTNGPRVYYGYSDRVHAWVNQFVELRALDFELWSYVETERSFFSYPIHEDDIPKMSQEKRIREELASRDLKTPPKNFEEYWISRVGRTLYDMFVNTYSKKMWMIDSNTELDTFSWSAKDNPINTGSRLAYKGSHLAYPVGYTGYNPYFDKTTTRARVLLNQTAAKYDLANRKVTLSDGTTLQGDVLISTVPIEELCDYALGDLPYSGRNFVPFVLPTKRVFPGNVRFLHYTGNEPYTRICEYKTLTGYEADDTLLVMETPARGSKLYPYMVQKYLDRARAYQQSLPEDVYSTGRLGTYKYSTIEQTIAQAFAVYQKVTGNSWDGMEREFYGIGDVSLIKDRKAAA